MCNRRNAPPQSFNKDNVVNGKIVWGTLEFIPKSIVTTLWEGSQGGEGTGSFTITLNDSYRNYDIIGWHIAHYDSGTVRPFYAEITVDMLVSYAGSAQSNLSLDFNWGYSTSNDYMDIKPSTMTNTNFDMIYRDSRLYKVIGIKYPQSRK